MRATRLRLGEGLSGRAMVERRVIAAGDYLAGEFQHMRETDVMAAQTGIGDLIVAPIIGDEGPLGAIEVYRRERHAFDDIDAAVLGGLADQAAIAITNARLIEELERSQASVAKRADTERALRDITARIAALREPEVILERVVDEAMRLLGTDGAHLTRMGEDGTYLVPVVVAGATDPEMQAWLLGLRFPMGGGINGLAAELGEPVWTSDYIADPRIPHDGNDDEVADRMGLRGMAAAPLRAPGGEVIGTLAISSSTPREFEPEERDLLQGLADQAAIAITNSTLLTRLTESEDRYRTLASSSPDMVFATDAEGRYTFLSDQASALLGWDIETSIGRHFMEFVAPGWEPRRPPATRRSSPSRTSSTRHGSTSAAATGRRSRSRSTSSGACATAPCRRSTGSRATCPSGSVSNASCTSRGSASASSSRPARTSSTAATPRAGSCSWPRARRRSSAAPRPTVLGMNFADFTAEESLAEAIANFEQQKTEHDVVRRFRYMVKYRDGTTFPAEITSVSVWEDGRFAGVQGTVRDVTMAERLERELRESQERYRFLVENSPDVVFSTDADGLFTFMSESMERMTGWKPEEVIGEHFSKTVEDASLPETATRWAALMEDPTTEQVAHINLQGPDGRLVPVEVSAVAMVDESGAFAGIHGSTRDISERARLERELRESEERYRYLVASSPDLVWLTDAKGTLTFVSDAARPMLGMDPTELMGLPYAEIFAPSARRDAAVRFRWLARPPDRRPSDAPAVPPFRRARGPGRDQRDRDDRRREVHRGARCGARRRRARPARARPAPPGRRAGGRRGTGPPGARAPRFGDPGAVLDDARVALGRAPARPRPGGGQGPARPAARPPARGARRDAGADLRAPARATSSRTG